MNTPPIALTIAGSDPSSGAGVQVDLKTFWSHGVYGCSVVTAITVQNTIGVESVYEVPPHIVGAQLNSLLKDIPIKWIKIGMVFSKDIILEIASILKKIRIKNIVLDPILLSSSGHRLLKKDAQQALIDYLFPLSELITPNIPEASTLTGIELNNKENIKHAARKLVSLGTKRVLIKGGHSKDDLCEDWFYDGTDFKTFRSKRIGPIDMHGSGCILCSAIVANLCLGKGMVDAIKGAKKFIQLAIKNNYNVGRGRAVWG